MTHFGSVEDLAYNVVIYAELGVKHVRKEDLDKRFSGWHFDLLDADVAWRTARAHPADLERGGKRERVLGDFWIGAHATVRGWRLLTRNQNDFKEFSMGSQLIYLGHRDAPKRAA